MAQPEQQQRRRYDSPVRREQAARTRERIIVAGWELAHESPVWDWRALTVRAVAERAGVNERTVYRHFPGERELHDAVMLRLEEEAGVTLEGLRLGDVAKATARVFAHVSSFPMVPRTPRDPTLAATDDRRRAALLRAVAAQALASADPDWLGSLITRRVPLSRWMDAYSRHPDDIKTVLDFS